MTNTEIETAINAAHRRLTVRGASQSQKRKAANEISRLHRMRSNRRVRQMEQQRGLING